MPARTGVLVVNLGTPDAPTPAAVRRFLAEFLSDRRVVDLPPILWQVVLRTVILPLRPKKSAHAYQQIWTSAGSPLLANTQALTRALARRLANSKADAPAVAMGMTYGNPSIARALDELRAAGATRVVVLPLYPQYSATTTAAALDRVDAALARWPVAPARSVITEYHADPAYVGALAGRIGAASTSFDHLLLSFHGIPERYAARGDPYREQCLATARLVAERLGLPEARWSVAFQSRLGRARWLGPYTEDRLCELARAGFARLAVACPGFAVDCLETLEEIAIRGAATYAAAGGDKFAYIPALNDDEAHVECLARLVRERLAMDTDAAR